MQAGIREIGDTGTRRLLVDKSKSLSVSQQLECLGLSNNAYYYKRAPEKQETVDLMNKIDELHTADETAGVERMRLYLRQMGIRVGCARVRRLMRRMGIDAIYAKKSLSKLGDAKYIKPYLLRNLTIDHANQVWSTDITYLRMSKGWMYLSAVMDVYSRKLLAYRLSNTLTTDFCIDTISDAISLYGRPEILNTDQGCQYTSRAWVATMEAHDITLSMDGRGRCKDNIWIERFWRTLKQEYIYINPADNVSDLFEGLRTFIQRYNDIRPHQGIGGLTPSQKYDGFPSGSGKKRSTGAASPASRQSSRSFSRLAL